MKLCDHCQAPATRSLRAITVCHVAEPDELFWELTEKTPGGDLCQPCFILLKQDVTEFVRRKGTPP